MPIPCWPGLGRWWRMIDSVLAVLAALVATVAFAVCFPQAFVRVVLFIVEAILFVAERIWTLVEVVWGDT